MVQGGGTLTDIVDSNTRSRIMASVKTRDTKPEISVRKALRSRGFRFRVHASDLPGTPDIVVPGYDAVVFVHGCFWHRHGCERATTPGSRAAYWRRKFSDNVRRDRRDRRRLQRLGWQTFIAWECRIDRDVERIVRALKGGKQPNDPRSVSPAHTVEKTAPFHPPPGRVLKLGQIRMSTRSGLR